MERMHLLSVSFLMRVDVNSYRCRGSACAVRLVQRKYLPSEYYFISQIKMMRLIPWRRVPWSSVCSVGGARLLSWHSCMCAVKLIRKALAADRRPAPGLAPGQRGVLTRFYWVESRARKSVASILFGWISSIWESFSYIRFICEVSAWVGMPACDPLKCLWCMSWLRGIRLGCKESPCCRFLCLWQAKSPDQVRDEARIRLIDFRQK